MDIIINSLYTKKEIFLREVISNASDALDKIRFLAIQKPELLKDEAELAIRVEVDEEEKALVVRDSGIGMTRAELINNLGTIARSGTTNFVEALKNGNINLIGQFGVGFYSTFLAGKRVRVTSKSTEDDEYIWESEAASEYTIRKADTPRLTRGTELRIFLKEEALEFLKEDRLEKLVSKYSGFIDFPIYLKKVNKESKEESWSRLNDNKAIWLRNSH
jgi:heat shock protein beta